MLIQGSNAPIIIEFDEDTKNIIDLSVVLIKEENELKKWGKADVTLEGTNCYCPLSQADTINFTTGYGVLEVKWTNKKGEVNFAEIVNIKIEKRHDKTILLEV